MHNGCGEIARVEELMPRERLFTLLNSYPQKRTVFLSAGNGYGKTALLASFFQKYSLLQHWITLTKPVYSFTELVSSLPPAPIEQEGWLVIDQSENLLLDKQNTADLVHWIEQLPPAVTIVFSGRSQLKGMPITRWKMLKIAITIEKEDLAFTKEEMEHFFQIQAPFRNANYEERQLLEELEGWPAGLALYIESIKAGNYNSRAELYHYIENEIITELPPDVLTFLLHASLFRNLDERLLMSYRQDWPLQRYLQIISENRLLVAPNQTNALRLNELFRKYFYRMAEREWGKETLKKQHYGLAKLYREHYQFIEALSHAVAAGIDEFVIDLIQDMADRYEPSSFLQVMDGYLEQVSPAIHLSEISLFIYRCIPASLLGQLIDPLMEIIEKAKMNNSPAYGELCHRMATIYFFQGELQKALEFSQISLTFSREHEDERMTALNLSKLAKIYRFLGQHTKAVTYSKQALAKSESFGFQHTQMHTLWNAAELLLDEDDIEKARRFAEQAIQVSEQCDKASVVYPMCSMSRYYRKKGNYKEAIHWAKLALDHANHYVILSDQGWANAALARCYAEIGDIEKAQDLMQLASDLFNENRHFHAVFQQEAQLIAKSHSTHQSPNDSAASEKLKIKLLGPFSIQLANTFIRLRRKACLRILLLLTSNEERKWSKEEIIGTLFPDEPEEAASNQFYVALSLLRKQLEPGLAKGRDSKYITYEDSYYSFRFDEAETDVTVLKQLMKQPYCKETALQAVELYQNGLLPEFPYEDWIEENRSVIREQMIQTLQKWASQCEEDGKTEDAASLLKTIIEMDPYDESYHLHYVKLLLRSNQAAKSRKAAKRAADFLDKELGINIRPQFDVLFQEENLKYSS